MDEDFVDLVEKVATLTDVRLNRKYQATLTMNFRRLVDAIGRLEADAQGMGYRFAVGLSGGSCRLCEKCVGQSSGQPCRHPFEARPAMEAVGIDVVETARSAGVPFEFPARENPVLTGLLLVD
jgi:predicted metal-binding protein